MISNLTSYVPDFPQRKIHQSLHRLWLQEAFYDKLTFIYLGMPNFQKEEDGLKSHFDKWMYVLKNLSKLQDRPRALQEKVFERLFSAAEIAKLNMHGHLIPSV